MPRVINLRDTGGRTPEGAVRIDRRTKWGNPFHISRRQGFTRLGVIDMYEVWIHQQIAGGKLDPRELQGEDLACWCVPQA